MDRLVAILLLVLLIAVTGVGFVVWRADQHAREAAERLACIERIEATATVALLTPGDRVDKEGRIDAIGVLGRRLDDC